LTVWGAAGTGKTALLTRWANLLSEGGHRVVWLSGHKTSNSAMMIRDRIRQFAAEPAVQDSVYLFVDDVHAITAPAGRSELLSLLESGPEHVRVIMAGRYQPFGTLAFLDAAGLMTELRNRDLAFTVGEAQQLSGTYDLNLSDEQADALVQRVGGWATALVLAVPWLKRAEDPAVEVERFSGDNRAVADYLVSEVVAGTTQDERDVMMTAAVSETISLELLVFLTNRSDAGEVMHRLAERNSLISETPDGFHYHPVFLSFISAESRRRGLAEDASRHSRASRWFADHGRADAALTQANSSGDLELIHEMLRRFGVELVLGGSSSLVSRSVTLLRASNPVVVPLFRLLAEVPFVASSPLARHLLSQTRRALDAREDSNRESEALYIVLTAFAATTEPDAQASRDALGSAWINETRHESMALDLLTRTAEAWCLDVLDRGIEAEAVLAGVRAAALQGGFDWFFLVTTELAAGVASRAGHWSQSLTLEDQLASLGLLSGSTGVDRVSANAAIAVAFQRYRSVEPVPTDVLDQLVYADPLGLTLGVLESARALSLLPRLDSDSNPRETFESLSELIRSDGARFPRLMASFVARMSAVALTLDGKAGARDIIDLAQRVLGDNSLEVQVAKFVADPPTRSRGPAEEALEERLSRADRVWHPSTFVDGWVELATVAEATGRMATADARVTEALRLARQYRSPRAFLLRGRESIRLIESRLGRFGHLDAFATEIIAKAVQTLPAGGGERPFGDLLTLRERDILNELPMHQSVAEIARRQSLSINTVKTHLRNIYQKLGAADRAEAVLVAQQQGLL
jgi:ATP/maltotriose-dependent transcriptional regulator MalT